MDLVSIERRGPVAVLTLNRPEALNALNEAILERLSARCDETAGDAELIPDRPMQRLSCRCGRRPTCRDEGVAPGRDRGA